MCSYPWLDTGSELALVWPWQWQGSAVRVLPRVRGEDKGAGFRGDRGGARPYPFASKGKAGALESR